MVLDAGADIEAEGVGGLTPLQWIGATGRYKPVAAFLRSRGATAPSIDIFWACSFGDTVSATRVLDADPSQVRARSQGGRGVARTLLIAAGADRTIRDGTLNVPASA